MPLRALLPKQTNFFDYFEQHAEKCVEGARLLLALTRNYRDVEAQAKAIKEVERQGDQITHTTIEMLHKTFITPIDRDEVHRLITCMDDVLDFIEAATERLWLYEVPTPTKECQELAEILLQACEQIKFAVVALRTLRDPMRILKACVEINRLENEGDRVLRHAVGKLFKESAHDPLNVIKWKEIYEILETGTDRCEDVANTIEGVVLEHA